MTTLFISDLHLRAERPELGEALLKLLQQRASQAKALYILGDLFEAWIGDDGILPEYQPVLTALRQLSDNGVSVYVMRGNRDFLFGDRFASLTGCRLIEDPTLIDLYGVPTLLMHGDTLCTDDVEYQRFRAMVRNPQWQAQVLSLSLPDRIAMAKQLRETSKEQTGQKAVDIMDANQNAVEQVLRQHGVTHLIHGHTHRPAIHRFSLDGVDRNRIVLGDWDEQPSVLVCDESGCQLEDHRVSDSLCALR